MVDRAHTTRNLRHARALLRIGCGAHDVISVELDLPGEPEPAIGAPAPNPSGAATSAFEVVVPDDCAGVGSLFLVEAAGRTFEVEVPEGCGAGSLITVELPTLEDAGGPASPAPEPEASRSILPAADDDSSDEETPVGNKHPLGRERSPPTKLTLPVDTPSAPRRRSNNSAAQKTSPASRPLHATHEVDGAFAAEPVEVLRSDGTWSLATPEDYEDLGCTYTVRLPDGRCKFMVEEADLRIPRCFLQQPVALDIVFFSGGGADTSARLFCIEEGAAHERACGVLPERSATHKSSLPGSRWVVRGSQSGAALLDVVIAAQPLQQRHLVVADPIVVSWPPGQLWPGCRARIHGMRSRPDLNGAECLALWWVEESQRWAAQLLACAPGGRFERMLVRSANLLPVDEFPSGAPR